MTASAAGSGSAGKLLGRQVRTLNRDRPDEMRDLVVGQLDVDRARFERPHDVGGEPRREHGHAVALTRTRCVRTLHRQLEIGAGQLELVARAARRGRPTSTGQAHHHRPTAARAGGGESLDRTSRSQRNFTSAVPLHGIVDDEIAVVIGAVDCGWMSVGAGQTTRGCPGAVPRLPQVLRHRRGPPVDDRCRCPPTHDGQPTGSSTLDRDRAGHATALDAADELGDLVVDLLTLLHQRRDLLDGVDDGRVVAAAELAGDGRIAEVGELPE